MIGAEGRIVRRARGVWVGPLIAALGLLSACGTSGPLPMGDSGPPLGAVGAPCTTDADCLARLTCFVGATGARAWPGGYCSRDCTQEDCPTGSRCGEAYYDPATDTSHYQCLAECDRADGTTGGCRAGYFCMFDGVCHVGCSSDAECTTLDYDLGAPLSRPGSTCELATGRCTRGTSTGGDTGASCSTDADCLGPYGICQGGTCLRGNCDLGGAYACHAGQECVDFPITQFQSIAICTPDCTIGTDGLPGAPGPCRPSIDACVPAHQDYGDRATHAFCYPTPGAQRTGSTSATVGSPCSTDADCPNPLGYGFCSGGSCQVAPCMASELAGMDVCGAGARCVTTTVDPAIATRFLLRDAELGTCVRDCTSSPSACEAPTTCRADHTCGL